MSNQKVTIPHLLSLKGKRKILNGSVMDASMAKIIDASNLDMAGAGASTAAMIIHGYTTPIPATLEQVLVYLGPIAKAMKRALLSATLPYGTYQASNEDALHTAIIYMQAGVDSVKIEGTGRMIDRVHSITSAGIPCMGHVGMTPQQIHTTGRYRSVGKTASEAVKVYKDALLLQEAGAWMIELECVPWKVAEKITQDLKVLTMGTGSGTGCDGQGLMVHDIWGLRTPVKPKLAKQYEDLHTIGVNALSRFKNDVKMHKFPPDDKVAEIPDDEFRQFLDTIG